MSPVPNTGFVCAEGKVGQKPEWMNVWMHVQCSFTTHSWPSPLLDDLPSSEDTESLVPPCWVSGHCVLTRLLLLDSRLCEDSHRGVPMRFFTTKLKVWYEVLLPSSFPLPPVHSPFLCSLLLKVKWYAYVAGANWCQCVYNFISQNQSKSKNSCTF